MNYVEDIYLRNAFNSTQVIFINIQCQPLTVKRFKKYILTVSTQFMSINCIAIEFIPYNSIFCSDFVGKNGQFTFKMTIIGTKFKRLSEGLIRF